MIRRLLFTVLATAMLAACSESEGGQTPQSTLTPPSDVAAERIGDTKVRVTWHDKSDSENGFTVWMRTGDETSPCKIGFTARNVESYTVDSGLELDKTYRFGVCADGRKGSSEIVYAPALELEDLTSPGIAFVGESTATESCIAFRYAPRNTAQARNVSCGICWSADHTPTVEDMRQDGPALDGTQPVMQVISNVLLEYGRPYRFRAYVRADNKTYYSDEIVASLGTEPEAIKLTWKKLDMPTLPSEISVYETTDKVGGHNFHAWYAVADVTGSVELRVSVPDAKATIDKQSASFGGDCYVMTNAGYFYSSDHVGIAVVDSRSIGYIPDMRGSLRTQDAEYQVMYHATRGIFGVGADGKPGVYWTETNGSNYYYDRPLPSVRGEAKYGGVSTSNPAKPLGWSPHYAISAGPVLLKDGKCPFDFTLTEKGTEYYLNNYEIIPYDIFGPTVSPDRTAVGHLADGRVVLFICDGRIAASGGATLTQLARILRGIGCTDALNLDGGGSTGMMVGTQHVNYHSDENRAVKSTIGFFRKK